MASSILQTTLWKLHSWLKTHKQVNLDEEVASEDLQYAILHLSTNDVDSMLNTLKYLLIFRDVNKNTEIDGLVDDCVDFLITSVYVEMNAEMPASVST